MLHLAWSFAQFYALDAKRDSFPLLILNTPMEQFPLDLIVRLLENASFLVCADGALNRLHDTLSSVASTTSNGGSDLLSPLERFIPAIVCGDFDSVRPEVLEFYRGRGSVIRHVSNQDTTDFEKCLDEIRQHLNEKGKTSLDKLLVLGGVGGRFDHSIQSINTLHKYSSLPSDAHGFFQQIYIISSYSHICLLRGPCEHVIECDEGYERRNCGLMPFDRAGCVVETSGLEWNITKDDDMHFGSLLSTSNHVLYGDGEAGSRKVPVVVDISSGSLVWTVERNSLQLAPFRVRRKYPIKRILLGLTGSVASIKVLKLVEMLRDIGQVQVVVTESARHFVDRADAGSGSVHLRPAVAGDLFSNDTGATDVPCWSDHDEWVMWQKRGDPVLHIQLRDWADVFVVAPLDANTLAKIANGLCDNLLTCIVRAWNYQRPIMFAPAMNTMMWTHPLTQKHIDAVAGMLPLSNVHIIPPMSKELMCGDVGVGAMASLDVILEEIRRLQV